MPNAHRLLLVLSCVVMGSLAAHAQTVTATVNAGSNPTSVALNPVTNKIYVANLSSANVTVIDGATNSTAVVGTGSTPVSVAVNSVTNKIYVANQASANVTVIDGATNATTTVNTGTNPYSVAVNPVTNKIYVANEGSANVTVIDGATNSTTTVNVGIQPFSVAVNQVTNKIYVANIYSNNVTVIDGGTNSTSTVNTGAHPRSVAVNPVTNQIYVACADSNNMTVIDGVTNSTHTVNMPGPISVAVNPVTNKIYVANGGGTATVIDGATNSTVTVNAGSTPYAVAVNPVTNTIYVANEAGGNLTVIDGATNSTTTVNAGARPGSVAVNPVTNKIYVANTNPVGTVTVIDGATNSPTTVNAGTNPRSVAVNAVTNKIYVANFSSNNVTVIDGATNATSTVNAGAAPFLVAVNSVTNKIYVTNQDSANVTVIDGATNSTSTVSAGSNPSGVAVNPVTNKIYVSNSGGDNVTVINGATNSTATVNTGSNPFSLAVNPVTNKIYVTNVPDRVTVIDGATNATTTVNAGNSSGPMTLNPVTNKIYLVNQLRDTVTVIDGATNSTTTINTGNHPFSVAVNPVTNKIYVSNITSGTVTVIDGATNSTTSVNAGIYPYSVAVNPVTNKIYVANSGGGVTVVDGATNSTTTVTAGTGPIAVAVNPVTNEIYVANEKSNNVTVIDEQQVQAIPLTTMITALAGNQTPSATPSFTFNAQSNFSPIAPAIANVFFQMDTWQGAWIAATGTGPSFTGTVPAPLQPGFHILYAYAADGQEATSVQTGSPLIGSIAAYGFVANTPSMTIAKTHTANFRPSQVGATYTVTVANAGNSPTTGTVTVTETAPTGLTVTSMAGNGWTCNTATCTRSDALASGSSYPAITVTVNVAGNVNSPLLNQVSVSGGGSATANASDSTVITSLVQPTLSVSRKVLNFGTSGSLATSPQTVLVTISGGVNMPWTATSDHSNITVNPGSGVGAGTFQVSATPVSSGVVTVTASGAINSPQTITVNVAGVSSTLPFGSFDTPVDGTTGVVGAIPVTGWALDNIEVTHVDIFREPVTGEPAGSLIFIGTAVFSADARPDVAAMFPAFPYQYRAGWGHQMLTNFLPNSNGSAGTGNGTYKLHAIAFNNAGNQQDLGTKTITVDNAHAMKPFGTIDTPGQGGTVSGADFVNFGWALTPQPAMIPTDGSTITVVIDGVSVGHPTYNQFRSDIANLFPGYANSSGAVGFFHVNTTTLANGVHTISWNVFDNLGHGEGLGSRYFNVLNTGGGGSVAAPEDVIESVAREPDAVALDADGSYSVMMEEVGHIELHLGAASGKMLVQGEAHSLPTGSTLKGGVFYWQPGPGFLGEYAMQFERPDGTGIQVRVNIVPKRY